MMEALTQTQATKIEKKEKIINTIALEVEAVSKALLSRPVYRRGPFLITDEDLRTIGGIIAGKQRR
ncbi:hypothetical protein [Labrys okinawensis]|uniref:hypothetical protein n=1 Tax=Labrys okinawensis TaxID=346911 RepID=UPI0011B28115|nr:hypothetical protein [Labrys okinawensis]